MGRVKQVLADAGKIEIQRNRYVKFPGGGLVGLVDFEPKDVMIIRIGDDEFRVSKKAKGYYAEGDKYDKTFPTLEDLVRWMNKEKVVYVGIDNN